MPAYGGNFLVRKTSLDKSAHGLMTQVMKAKVLQILPTSYKYPSSGSGPGPKPTIVC
jgi:hypothetical protein